MLLYTSRSSPAPDPHHEAYNQRQLYECSCRGRAVFKAGCLAVAGCLCCYKRGCVPGTSVFAFVCLPVQQDEPTLPNKKHIFTGWNLGFFFTGILGASSYFVVHHLILFLVVGRLDVRWLDGWMKPNQACIRAARSPCLPLSRLRTP